MNNVARINNDDSVKRHAKIMLWTPGIFITGLGLVCLLSLTQWPNWIALAGPTLFAASALVSLIGGPRYVGILMILDAVILFELNRIDSISPVASWTLHSLYALSLFAMALWPLRERQYSLNKRDVLFPWSATLGIYLGIIGGIVWGAFSPSLIIGATNLMGAVLMVQSSQNAWKILRGPREAVLPERGIRVNVDDSSDSGMHRGKERDAHARRLGRAARRFFSGFSREPLHGDGSHG